MADTQEKKAEGAAAAGGDLSWPMVIAGIFGIIASLYLFLVGLALMGDAFKCLGGRGASSMFTSVNNPIAGLMVGILATVLVQSSSTSTSIVVGLVSADQITVTHGIPIIMGANIGTSVTNTIVSMGQSGNRLDLERAFAGATVHDMFNMLTVLTLLPIEIITAAISGEGGLIYWIAKGITEQLVGGEKSGALFDSPIKVVTSPVVKGVISNNKYVINALTLELGEPMPLGTADVNASECASDRRLKEATWADESLQAVEDDASRALLNRRLDVACPPTQYYCVSSDLDKNFKSISSKAYASKLTKCAGHGVTLDEPCTDNRKCYLDAGKYYEDYVTNGHIIKGGFVQDAGDMGGGIIALILSLIMLCGGLFGLVKCLQMLLIKKAKKVIARAIGLNDYLALLVGIGITIVVQSSSVTTSALTPLCGMGVIPLEKMLPLTLGANIGTTITALIAALTSLKFGALQIALCHLLFNIIGILIWFPLPPMRQIPLNAARLLGLYASFYRFVPGLYILVMFVCVPAVLLGVSALYDASVAGGIIVSLILASALGGFLFWWIALGGCYKVLSREDREKRLEELKESNSEIRAAGDHDAGHAKEAGAQV